MTASLQKFAIILSAAIASGCHTIEQEIMRETSPDGKATLHIHSIEKKWIQLPTPEPTEIIYLKARVSMQSNIHHTCHNSDFNIAPREHLDYFFDIKWAPDSAHVAYRAGPSLFIVGAEAQLRQSIIQSGVNPISSFKWASNCELIIVTKEIAQPRKSKLLCYPNFIDKTKATNVIRLKLDKAPELAYSLPANGMRFLFHSPGFRNQEISPYSNKIILSDGASIQIFDNDTQSIIAKSNYTGTLDGVWWEGPSKIIFGTNLLGGNNAQFYTLNINDNTPCEQVQIQFNHRYWEPEPRENRKHQP